MPRDNDERMDINTRITKGNRCLGELHNRPSIAYEEVEVDLVKSPFLQSRNFFYGRYLPKTVKTLCLLDVMLEDTESSLVNSGKIKRNKTIVIDCVKSLSSKLQTLRALSGRS